MNMNGWLIFSSLCLLLLHLNLCAAVRCTFYGEPGNGPTGERTAGGTLYNSNGMTCSTLPHVPLGSLLKVTNQRTGKSITVTVTDRIGGTTEDTIDLSYGAFGQLADHDEGVIPCSYEIQ